MLRLFVAIDVPDAIKSQLTGWRMSMSGARWVQFDQMHLTLAFLGEHPMSVYDEVCQSLEDVEFSPFDLEFQKVGFFGSKKVPRTLWADVCSSAELIGLQNKVCKRMQELGIKVEARKFRPHLTLARLNGASYEDVGRFLEAGCLAKSDSFSVDSFALFSSKLLPRGAVYHIEQTYFGHSD
jgi:2'-5' RNA ligase